MSFPLISRNRDLRELVEHGYEVEISGSYLILNNVPYVNSKREIKKGKLVSNLDLAGQDTVNPVSCHTVCFSGEHPCDERGEKLRRLECSSDRQNLGEDFVTDHTLSTKPIGGPYHDYFQKMRIYAEMISAPARSIDQSVTARTYVAPIESSDSNPVFKYGDTASFRAGITAIADKLSLAKVGIVGVGGSGSYVLDLIAKTPIQEIHLFDDDDLLPHNAFRCPGAPSLDIIRGKPKKVDYLRKIYSAMRNGIVSHAYRIDEDNLDLLNDMKFVFVCIDAGNIKRLIFERLEVCKIPFIDVGMGIYKDSNNKLAGILRVTMSTNKERDHMYKHVSFGDNNQNEEYQNIQIADMNALNAALAVIKWKKLFCFYADQRNEFNSLYTIDCNLIANAPCEEK